jgi:hypothetical protein
LISFNFSFTVLALSVAFAGDNEAASKKFSRDDGFHLLQKATDIADGAGARYVYVCTSLFTQAM